MKWFKHMSKSRHDTKVMRIIRKHGLRGYGLYFAVLEGIAFDLEPDKPIPELEETAQDIAAFFNEDTLKVQEIVDDCVREGLLQVNPETKRILCLKLLVYLDNTLSQNPQVKAILSNFKSLEADTLKQIRLDETRSDNNKDPSTAVCSDGVPSSPLQNSSKDNDNNKDSGREEKKDTPQKPARPPSTPKIKISKDILDKMDDKYLSISERHGVCYKDGKLPSTYYSARNAVLKKVQDSYTPEDILKAWEIFIEKESKIYFFPGSIDSCLRSKASKRIIGGVNENSKF